MAAEPGATGGRLRSILDLLGDPDLSMDRRERSSFAFGLALDQVPQEGDLLSGVLSDREISLDLTLRMMFLLGVVSEWADRPGDRLAPHHLSETLGDTWSVLGYLVSPELRFDTDLRALFLLGTLAVRSRAPIGPVLDHLSDDRWQMSIGDKAVIMLLAAALRPPVAIDAGTFLGRSAAALSLSCGQVVSIDWDTDRAAHVSALDNVEFRSGLAAEVVDEVLAEHPETNLVVLDADHGEAGIAAEVASVLRHRTRGLRALVIHDSAMASCRRGLESIAWEDEPSVRGYSLDFLPGSLNECGELVGGLALAWISSDDPRRTRSP